MGAELCTAVRSVRGSPTRGVVGRRERSHLVTIMFPFCFTDTTTRPSDECMRGRGVRDREPILRRYWMNGCETRGAVKTPPQASAVLSTPQMISDASTNTPP